MTNTAKRLDQVARFGDICEAAVLGKPVAGRVSLRLISEAWPEPIQATLAIDGQADLGAGDRVLAAPDSHGRCYVIGVIERKATPDLVSRSGARARLESADGQEKIQVLDAEDRLIFEYRPEDGGGAITMPAGDLALRAPMGDIRLEAGRRLHCRAGTDIDVSASSSVALCAGQAQRNKQVSFFLSDCSAKLKTHSFALTAARADLRVAETEYLGVALCGTLERVRLVTGKLERLAERVIERAVDVYREVEGLCQLKAGRVRTLVEDEHYAKAKRTYLLAEEDVKIDGNKIRLG
jgi:hypothetical protein